MARKPEPLVLHAYCICGEMIQVPLEDTQDGVFYTFGGVKDALVSVYLHRDAWRRLSRIQCHIKLVEGRWTLFDGCPPELPLMALPGGAKESRASNEGTHVTDGTVFSQSARDEKEVKERWRPVTDKGVVLDPGQRGKTYGEVELPPSMSFGFIRKPREETAVLPAPVYLARKHLWVPGEPGPGQLQQVPFAYFVEVRRRKGT